MANNKYEVKFKIDFSEQDKDETISKRASIFVEDDAQLSNGQLVSSGEDAYDWFCEYFEDALEEKLVDTSGVDLGNLSSSEMSVEMIKDVQTGEAVWKPLKANKIKSISEDNDENTYVYIMHYTVDEELSYEWFDEGNETYLKSLTDIYFEFHNAICKEYGEDMLCHFLIKSSSNGNPILHTISNSNKTESEKSNLIEQLKSLSSDEIPDEYLNIAFKLSDCDQWDLNFINLNNHFSGRFFAITGYHELTDDLVYVTYEDGDFESGIILNPDDSHNRGDGMLKLYRVSRSDYEIKKYKKQ